MKHFYRIGLVLLVYTTGIFLFGLLKSKPLPNFSEAGPTEETVETPPTRIVSSDESYDRLIANRVSFLTEQADYRTKLAEAGLKTTATRQQAATLAYPAWTEAIRTNRETYLALLEKAKQDPRGRVVCTICNGYSYIPCAMCKDHDGKCTTCGGSGSDVGRELCPSCYGRGKCYLCNGNGKMFCPFCDDGMIRIDWPPPRGFPPLN